MREPTAAETTALVERVAALRPSFFWVGLSTPKQEAFMAAHAARLELYSNLITSGLPLPYSKPAETLSVRQKARQGKARSTVNNPTEGVIHQLLGDYAI